MKVRVKSHFRVSAMRKLEKMFKNYRRQFDEWKEIYVSSFPKYMSPLQGHVRVQPQKFK